MKITNIEKQMGEFQLNIPSLHIKAGEIHGLLGGNGCGKSTLAKAIVGAVELDRGEIDFEGIESNQVTLLSQRPYLLHRNVYDNLVYPLQVRHMEIDENMVRKWLERIGLWEQRNQYARSLSSGEQQKLSFARALIFHPQLIIIDETLSNLDPESLQIFEEWISEWQSSEKITWIIISHQLILINNLCDQVHFMKQGRILESATKEEVIFHSQNEEIRKFVACHLIQR